MGRLARLEWLEIGIVPLCKINFYLPFLNSYPVGAKITQVHKLSTCSVQAELYLNFFYGFPSNKLKITKRELDSWFFLERGGGSCLESSLEYGWAHIASMDQITIKT
jgi:hypothetical protein